MPKRASKPEIPLQAPFWYLSFGDMVTLLLSFFVMMATFASYTKDSLQKFAGVCSGVSATSLFGPRGVTRDSVVPEAPRSADFTTEGSEKPDSNDTSVVQKPRPLPWVPDVDAYSRRKVISIPSEKLFSPDGSLSAEGKELLRLVCDFVKQLPCKAVISETGPDEPWCGDDARLARAQAVLEYFTGEGALPPAMFGVSSSRSGATSGGRRTVQIMLLSGSITR